ncbi:ATP-binding cassette domain-containing protein [candidate division KSB1 bacterium]
MELIKLKDIYLKKKNKNGAEKEILRGISFSLKEKSVLSVLGPSGSGKTSLLRLLNRIEDPTTGEIYYKEKLIKEYEVTGLRKKVAFLWQTPIVFKDSVREEFCFTAKISKATDKLDFDKILHLAQDLGFERSFLDKNPQEMSVGEKQRLSLIRILMSDPEIILADEPTSALDIHSRDIVQQVLEEYLKNGLKGLIMVTHDLHLAENLSTEGIIIEEGKIKHSGYIKDITGTWMNRYKES